MKSSEQESTCMDSDDVGPSWLHPSIQSRHQINLLQPNNEEHHKTSSNLNGQNFFHFRSSHSIDPDTNKFAENKTQHHANNGFSESENRIQHGFSFGRRSLSENHEKLYSSGDLRDSWSGESIEDEDEEEDKEELKLTDIYKSTGDIPGALLYKTDTERRAMSKRIGGIGFAGQNLSLGHILGCVGDDSSLIPSRLHVLETCYVLDEVSPVQTDIRWCPPDNVSRFQRLVYEFEFCDITSEALKSEELSWCPVARVHYPVIRVYRSESSLLLGKRRLKRAHHDTIYKLRVRAVGHLMGRAGSALMRIGRSLSSQELSHEIVGDWSSDVFLSYVGWDNQGRTQQLTSL
ncbi:hypothetical protein EGW08_019409 [Elysia chlorotica]|uniref:Uncharacterized protein n=1 Tax=Elysia chlorotica TaxID=188477 RepID=A0A3S1B5X3_ELYCH|nr:hypothetical protein EGW08_019409 [Elysia chlorotica]